MVLWCSQVYILVYKQHLPICNSKFWVPRRHRFGVTHFLSENKTIQIPLNIKTCQKCPWTRSCNFNCYDKIRVNEGFNANIKLTRLWFWHSSLQFPFEVVFLAGKKFSLHFVLMISNLGFYHYRTGIKMDHWRIRVDLIRGDISWFVN